jgi:rare lipoprotein A
MAVGAFWRGRSLAEIALLGLMLAGCASGSGGGAGVGHYVVGPPYEENGVWYYPAVDHHYDRTGIASWYGADYDGKPTANGEIYDMNGLTAAHPTLPLPSIVEVTDLQNGRSLQLRVNDRGPFVDGRLIDLSRRAARLLGFETQGTAPVRVKILEAESIAAADEAIRNAGIPMVAEAPIAGVAAMAAAPAPVPVAAAPPLPPTAPRASVKLAAAPVAAPQMPSSSTRSLAGSASPAGSIYIQAGAFARRDNAERVEARIAGLGNVRLTTASVGGTEWYRVRLGPIETAVQADRLLARVVGSGYPEARIVSD